MNRQLINMMAESDQLESGIFDYLAILERSQVENVLHRLASMLESNNDEDVFIMQLASYGLARLMQIKYSSGIS